MEVGETLREAAVREVLEETGLQLEVDELLGVFDRIVRDDEQRTLYHYVLIDFLCRKSLASPRLAVMPPRPAGLPAKRLPSYFGGGHRQGHQSRFREINR